MKKLFLSIVFVAMTCIGCKVNAQNCAEIVRPYLEANHINPSDYPQPKLEWRCQFSYNTFFLCDSVPEGAMVFGIEALTNILTGEHPDENFEIDLEVFSYYAWDFINFQKQDDKHTIYFDTHKSTNRYLGVRTYNDAYGRTERPEYYYSK